MKTINLRTALAAAAIFTTAGALALPHGAMAQTSMMAPMSNTASPEIIPQAAEVTIVAKIKSIDLATRQVTVVGKDGNKVTLDAGPAVRLNLLKVGDTVTAQYYRSVAFAVSQPGAAVPPDQLTAIATRPANAPGGVAVRVIRISGLVFGVDLSSNTIEVVDPKGGEVHLIQVTDPARIALLPKLQVGSTVTAVVSETLAISIEPAPKGLFGLF